MQGSRHSSGVIGSIHDEIVLEVPEEQAEEAACMPQEIMKRIGCQLLHPIQVMAEGRALATLAG